MLKLDHASVWPQILQDEPHLEFAVLVGSRAKGNAHAGSDWDIALQCPPTLDWLVEKSNMRLDLYQAETARIAAEQSALLAQAKGILATGRGLTALEQSGVLHALQVLIENAIGKTKQLLKAQNQPVPVSGYDAFKALAHCGLLDQSDLAAWNAVIGLRNRIVHDYMNIDMDQVLALVVADKVQFIVQFLLKDAAP